MRLALLLDLSRLVLRASRPAPTGIDRVEFAYARYLRAGHGGARSVLWRGGRHVLLPDDGVAAFLDALEAAWRDGRSDRAERAARRLRRWALFATEADLLRTIGRSGAIYLNVSHHHLDRTEAFGRLAAAGAKIVVLIHDLIPLTHPEYARPGEDQRHRARLETVVRHAAAVIANSAATATALAGPLAARGATIPVAAAPLGIDEPLPVPPAPTKAPTFLCLGTIEPRKNHLLLLHLWRRFTEQGGAVPHLVLAGARGWECEAVVDLLDRCVALRPHVTEAGAVDERGRSALIRSARALLLPSFAEGYGLPVGEALAAGLPAIVSDLPALREVGGDVPEYLDPLDAAAWARAIRDYAADPSPRREAQLARLAGWRRPTWREHFRIVDQLIAQVAGGG
ncbi:MAG: glycosyltransferase family 1 protein [Acetobacteraceae bacterium]|nr:glycosyltransferase family 1 protein [Acetobacteraceae bacterium]